MALTFYYGSGSPFSWRVWLALEHKQLPYEHKLLSFSKREQRQPEYLRINPRGKVPALVDGTFSLYESSVIVEYLEDQYPTSGRPLFPREPRARALVRRMVREADAYLGERMEDLLAVVTFTPESRWDHHEIMRRRDKVVKEIHTMTGMMLGNYMAGELSAADFTVYPMLALLLRLDRRKPDLSLGHVIDRRTAAWMKRIETLPYFEKTIPPHWKEAAAA